MLSSMAGLSLLVASLSLGDLELDFFVVAFFGAAFFGAGLLTACFLFAGFFVVFRIGAVTGALPAFGPILAVEGRCHG